MSEQKKKSQAKIMILAMGGAAAAGLYWWWKNRQEQGLAGELIPEQPLIFPEGGGGGQWPDLYIPEWPAFPEPTPVPENGFEQPPINITTGGGGIPSYIFAPPITETTAPPTAPVTPTPTAVPQLVSGIGVVQTAKYPEKIVTAQKRFMELFTGLPFYSVAPTEYKGSFAEAGLNWIGQQFKNIFSMPIIPAVEAQPAPAPAATIQYPKPLPSVSTPEGFLSTPVQKPTELGFVPQFLRPSWMKTAAQQPATTQPVATTSTVTQLETTYQKPKWLGG
jgi:hypothetical protein